MMKTVGFVTLWLGGSAAAVAVAWTGVSVVDDDLINPAPANTVTVSEPDLPETTAIPDPTSVNEASATATPVAHVAPTPQPPSNQITPEPTALPASTPGAAPTPQPQPTTPATSQPVQTPTSTPTTPAPAPTSTPPPNPTPITPAPTPTAEPAQTLTFNLIGGSTAISFSPTGVQVLWATPNPGFEVDIEPESPGIKVEFRADHHRSRIDAWWSNGPQTDIREEPDD